jgi:predicted regulator of Ras-like GTPase activity (Roadblock/LC7/MglB family)
MSAPGTGTATLPERVRAELELIRSKVSGVYGSLVATSDGFLVAHDVPDLEPTEIAALVATTRALASRTTNATGRGEFREALARGSKGYLAAYAAGVNAIVAVIGTNDLNIGLLHLQTREVVARIAAHSPEFRKWTSASGPQAADHSLGGRGAGGGGLGSRNTSSASTSTAGPAAAVDAPPPLPKRRPPAGGVRQSPA